MPSPVHSDDVLLRVVAVGATLNAERIESPNTATVPRFDLTVVDPLGLSDTATTSVTVTGAGSTGPGLGSSGGGSLGFLMLGLLLVFAFRLWERASLIRTGPA